MGKIRIVLLFDEENEKQRQAGEFLKTQKRCKTALITELIHAWIYNKEGKALFPDKSMSGIDIEKVKEELLHDKDFLLQIESSMKRMDEKTVCESREDSEAPREVRELLEKIEMLTPEQRTLIRQVVEQFLGE